MVTTQIIILVVLLIFSGFFSGTETALMSLNMIKVKSLLKQDRKGAKALYRIKQNPHKLLITILIGNNVVNIGAASLATVVFTNLFGSSGIGIATGVMTFLVLVFGEITPKTFASQNAEKISLIIARPIELLSIALSPLIKVFELITRFVNKIFGSAKGEEISEDELKTIVTMGREQGILDREAATMMHNVLKFEGKKVTEVMTPDANLEMLNGNKKLKQVIEFVVKSPYSKYPVYLNSKDNIIGILDVDDVLKYTKNKKLEIKIKNIVKEAYFVPESKEIDDLLTEFGNKKVPLAIVVNEYGHVEGMVSVEDILEEIVGDIFDKSRRESILIKKTGNNLAKVDAKASVEEVNKILNLELKPGNFNTIAGFIENYIGKIPKKGEKIKLKNVIIEVDKVTTQGIKGVKITKN